LAHADTPDDWTLIFNGERHRITGATDTDVAQARATQLLEEAG